MQKIALIGANGYIGTALFKKLYSDKKLIVIPVTRLNYTKFKKEKYDYVINAAMPSSRFWASKNPGNDFCETVAKTADIAYGWRYGKIIQISTISARSEVSSIYGKHKLLAEKLCNPKRDLIVRLTSTFDNTLKKGALIDILKGNQVFVSRKSRYSFSSLNFVCEWIKKNIDKKGVIEVGAKNSISLEEIAEKLNLNIEFSGRTDIQEVKNPEREFPDANLVLKFMKNRLK